MNKFAVLSFIVTSCVVLSACFTHAPARYGGAGRSLIHNDPSYKLAVLEFGEFGSYADPSMAQKEDDIKLLRNTPRPLLVMYIHGWHNNVTSRDVDRFKGFLSRLSEARDITTNHLNIVGIYFAWPGESLSVPVLNTFTFWDRKRAAERIASNDDCLDAIEQLSHAARDHGPSYTFLIGHSFGGLIVERTVAHTLRTLQGNQNIRPPWDLALILNPASDSILARQIVSSLQGLYTYDGRQSFVPQGGGPAIPENQPAIVELQSENDTATAVTFPVGSSLGSILGGHWAWNKVPIPRGATGDAPGNNVSERQFYLSTPGNSRYLINYSIVHVDAPIPKDVRDAFDANLRNNPVNRIFYTSAPRDSETAATAALHGAAAPNSPISNWKAWQIRYAGSVDPIAYGGNARVPFWIVRVPSDIIDNHGGIWSDNNMALMAAIFRLHRPIATQHVVVSGHIIEEKTVLHPAKAYNLPNNPELQKPAVDRSNQ